MSIDPTSNGPEPLGVSVCRLSLDLGRGRFRHQRQVGIAIRAAMFAELSLGGRLVGLNGPEAVGDSDTGSPLLDSVHRAVANRSTIGWRRWFNHVDADRMAATGHLLQSGVWRSQGRRIVDNTGGRTLLEQRQVALAVSADQVPPDVTEAILVLLVAAAGGTGRPLPRRCRRLARSWLPPLLATSGRAGDAVLNSTDAALRQILRSAPVRLLAR
jgi:hypothetical protein